MHCIHAMTESDLPPSSFDGLRELGTEYLHRPLKMPKPKWGLSHLQNSGAVQSCRAICGLLGIELEL